MSKFYFAILILVMGSVGCSVEQKKALNEPPVVREGLLQFSQEAGIFQAEDASLFLWPAGVHGDALSRLSEEIGYAGQVMEAYKRAPQKSPELELAYQQAVRTFFGLLQPDFDPNQANRDYSNIKYVDPATTAIKIGADPARPFSIEGLWNGRPIVQGAYDHRDKTMIFVVPQLSADFKPTGEVWVFQLGRRPDIQGKVSFSGGVRFGTPNGPHRYGSAKIHGSFIK